MVTRPKGFALAFTIGCSFWLGCGSGANETPCTDATEELDCVSDNPCQVGSCSGGRCTYASRTGEPCDEGRGRCLSDDTCAPLGSGGTGGAAGMGGSGGSAGSGASAGGGGQGGSCFRRTFEIDWADDCVPPGSEDYPLVSTVPAGTYTLTALESAGLPWSTPDPPTKGWAYFIQCNFTDPTPATPMGTFYATLEEAFAAVTNKQVEITWPGGDLMCRFIDQVCEDNSGSVMFELDDCP